MELIKRKVFKEGNQCLNKYYQTNPNDRDVCLQLLLSELKTNPTNYQRVIELFCNLDKIESNNNKYENNLYLYLLSYITVIPKKYEDRDITDFIDYEHDDKELRTIKIEISKSKFTYAHSLLSSSINYDANMMTNELLKALLSKVIYHEKRLKQELLEYARNHQITKIISILESKRKTRYLSQLETYILILCETINEVIETNNIPIPTINCTFDIYEAIVGENYKLAQDLSERFISKIGRNKEDDVINILLTYLNKIIDGIKVDYQEETMIPGQLSKELATTIPNYPSYDAEITEEIKMAEEIAYYIKSMNMELDSAKKSMGIKSTTLLLIKLVYARDYYIEDNYTLGDILIDEVEKVIQKPAIVLYFLDKVKAFKDNYKPTTSYNKKLTPNN